LNYGTPLLEQLLNNRLDSPRHHASLSLPNPGSELTPVDHEGRSSAL
jgi:hypothetical protein